MKHATPFVQWAGGKRSLIPFIKRHLPTLRNINHYHEPFVGGGAVFFAFQHLIKRATLADLNAELTTAYQVAKNNVENLIFALINHQNNHKRDTDYYLKIRKQAPKELLDIAARFLYLNKTCYNGLYRVNKSGQFSVPKGGKKNPAICNPQNLRAVAQVLQKATIRTGQFDESIATQKGDFVYCDPPYDGGTFVGYQPGGFNRKDQIRLKKCVDHWTRQGVSVMVSNANTLFIRDIYKNYTLHSLIAPRKISCKGAGKKTAEVLITNYNISGRIS